MRVKSHLKLGRYLASHYLPHLSCTENSAFLLGCIQPDSNPITYLKGSVRFQLLRGHNRYNTLRYRKKLSMRLERRQRLSLLDYYSLGKLIHYTADAYTYAHNAGFPLSLQLHRRYEDKLQQFFLRYLESAPKPAAIRQHSLSESVQFWDRKYGSLSGSIYTDAFFAFTVCCHIVSALHPQRNSSFAAEPSVLGVTMASN